MKTEPSTTITFHGGVSGVTGANFLIEDNQNGTKLLVDCGLFQGSRVAEKENMEPFPYDPSSIDAVIITHAHIDHIGRLPKLIHDGFTGPIYSTKATKDIAAIMLEDSAGIIKREAEDENRPPIYTEDDVDMVMRQWEGVDYHTETQLAGGYRFELKDAGHILGSAMVFLSRGGRTLVVTGDLGNTPAALVRDTESIEGAHYVVMESVYGDRNHESAIDRGILLRRVVQDTISRDGVLMVPAFSLERTQELLYEMNEMVEGGYVKEFPVFLDSPLAIKVTSVYRKYHDYFNERARAVLHGDNDLFKFPNLSMTLRTEESKAINNVPNPKMIIAGSGMSNAGRILHHEKRYLPDPNSTLLLVGYQAVGTLGRRILEGAKTVTIHGEKIPVRAKVARIHSYSSHKDSHRLLDFVKTGAGTIERVFVAMGEPESSAFLAQRLRDYVGVYSQVPERGDSVELTL